MKKLLPTAILLSVFCAERGALAQSALERPLPLPALGRSLVSNGDTTAMAQNPANIAFLPGPELRWSGYFLNNQATSTEQGHSFAFALPLGFLPIATGLRFDLVNPTDQAAVTLGGLGLAYQWLIWDVAVGNEVAALGFSFERSYSNQAAYHGFGTWSVGLTTRPLDYIGAAAVIHQVDAPTSDGGLRLGTSYEFGATFRPTGDALFELSAEAKYVDERGGYWMPRLVLDFGILELGHLRGDVTWVDPQGTLGAPSWVASTALVVNGNSRVGSAQLGLGSRYGDALTGDAASRFYENLNVDIAIRGFREDRAADNLGFAVRYRLENTPGPRDHVRLLRELWALADEKNMRALVLELRATPADSLAHAQEFADAILYLRSKGKKVLCHLEEASGSSLYVCANADRILINPAGSLRYSGIKSQSFYLEGLLSKLGISADFVRIGKHKSAPETFARSSGTKTAIEDKTDLLQQVELELSSTIAWGRELSLPEVRTLAAEGPFTAAEAKSGKLVDGFAFDDMIPEKVREFTGERLVMEKGSRGPERPDRFGPQKRLAIVYVDGDMVDGRSQTIPFIGIRTAGSYTIAESLQQVREDATVGAVVLRVETGGGAVMAADLIWREVQLTAAKKPVIVSMGTAAASGGYYISSAGSYIYANPLTITGSIGIFYGKVEASQLLRNIGVNVETLKTTSRADAESPFRGYTDEEREVLKRKIEQFYGLFLRRVADGRKLEKNQIDQVGRGRVWTGRQAVEHKLVDELGGLRQALAKARVLGGVRDDAPILELPVPHSSLLGKLLGVEGLKAELGGAEVPLPGELLRMVQSVAPYALYAGDQPLARIELLPHIEP